MFAAFAIFGFAIAAFCVWLAVRIMNRRERWAKWTLVALIVMLPVLYAGSFGPVHAVLEKQIFSPICHEGFRDFYAPLLWLAQKKQYFADALWGYANSCRRFK